MNRLLIIDDQAGILQMLKRRLTKLNYVVHTASDEESTLEVLGTTEIDLVLLDYMMPQTTGFDLFMNFHKKYDVPVIMMTAHSSTHLAIEFIKSRGVDFIEKPLDIDVLNLRIDRAIMDARAFKRECIAKEKVELALKLTNKALKEKTEILELKKAHG
jgi:DNA-binding NtrC family response regulator